MVFLHGERWPGENVSHLLSERCKSEKKSITKITESSRLEEIFKITRSNHELPSLPLNHVPEHYICTPLVYLQGRLLYCFLRQPVPCSVPLLYNSAFLTNTYNGSGVAHIRFRSLTQYKCRRKKVVLIFLSNKVNFVISPVHDVLTHFCEYG